MFRHFTTGAITLALLFVTLGAVRGQVPPPPGFWLVPVDDGVEARSGIQFPAATDQMLAAQLTEANAVSVAGKTPLTVMGLRGKGLLLSADLTSSGDYYAVVSLAPEQVTIDAASFDAYLRQQELTPILSQRSERGERGKAAIVRFQRYAKALLHHPGTGTTATSYQGQRFELVPLADPAKLRVGDTLRISVTLEGRAAASAHVAAGYAGEPGTPTIRGTADADGIVSIPLRHAGLWYLTSSVMRHAASPDVDWESFTASLTLSVR